MLITQFTHSLKTIHLSLGRFIWFIVVSRGWYFYGNEESCSKCLQRWDSDARQCCYDRDGSESPKKQVACSAPETFHLRYAMAYATMFTPQLTCKVASITYLSCSTLVVRPTRTWSSISVTKWAVCFLII